MLSISLLLDVVLGTTLLSLAGIVLLLVLGLRTGISRQAGDTSTDGTRHAISNAGAKVVELTLGLLLLSLEVLLATALLQALELKSQSHFKRVCDRS